MALNDAGKMIEKIWHEIPNDFTNIHLCEYITMLNHIHGIIEITAVGADSISAPNMPGAISAQKPDKKKEKMDFMIKRAEMDSAPTGTGMKPRLS